MLGLQHDGLQIAEVLLDVADRAEVVLLFAGPERDADRPPRLHADRLEDPHRFHRDGDAGAVVGGAGARVPRVEVAAEHHDFGFQHRIDTRQLSDDVEPFDTVGHPDRQRERELHRLLAVEHPDDATVVLA